MAMQTIDQFQYNKIQPKPIDLSMRLWGIATEFEGLFPRASCWGLLYCVKLNFDISKLVCYWQLNAIFNWTCHVWPSSNMNSGWHLTKPSVVDLGEGPAPLILGNKRRNDRREKKPAGYVNQNWPPLDPPLVTVVSDTMLPSLATPPDLLGSLLLPTGLKKEMPWMKSTFKTLHITYHQRWKSMQIWGYLPFKFVLTVLAVLFTSYITLSSSSLTSKIPICYEY